MRTLPVVLVASLLVSLGAGSARAVTTTVYPQAADWAGFVDELGDSLVDEVATGALSFALFGDQARGYVRFPLSTIPPGSTINSVTYRPWTCNHDLAGGLCLPVGPKTATVTHCAEDPLTSTVPLMWSAIGAGPTYATFAIPRSGPAWCLDWYVQSVVDLGPQGIADVQAALPAGFITLGLQSDVRCDPASDHIDWIGFSESIVGADPGCVITTDLPGSRMALDIDYTPACAIPTPSGVAGSICAGASFMLDGTASTGCPAASYLYQWSNGPTVLCAWSSTATCSVTPGSTTTYTLEVACSATPACLNSTPVTVTVATPPTPSGLEGDICAGDVFALDGSATTGCPVGGYLYQWLDGATVVCGWSSTPTCNVNPGATTLYTLEVACSAAPTCTDSSTSTVTVGNIPTAAAQGGQVCVNDPFVLNGTGSAGCPAGGFLYRWLQGATVLCGWSPTPTCNVASVPTPTVYTLEVACAVSPTCVDQQVITVDTRICNMAVKWEAFDAVAAIAPGSGSVVDVRFSTLEELDTNYFAIERADSATGSFVRVGDLVEARGAGYAYHVADVTGHAGQWYRVVEYTSNGRGDETPAFLAHPEGAGSGRMGRSGGVSGGRVRGR